VDVKEAYSIAFSVPSFYHRMEINIVDLEDVRANVIESQNLNFAQFEMLGQLETMVASYNRGECSSEDIARELSRMFGSIYWLGMNVKGDLESIDQQLDTLTWRNARGLKI